MGILIAVLWLIVGIAVIVKGGDFFVDAATWIAKVSGIPTLIVGATVVSVATAMPETLVSTFAAAEGKVDMAIGNAAGSVTANIGLIMALSLLFLPTAIRRRDYLPKSIIMISAAVLIVAGGLMGEINVWMSAALLAVFVLFLWENLSGARKAMSAGQGEEEKPDKSGKTIVVNVVKFILGLAGIVWGARLLVDNASDLARFMGISERIISVTIVAIGTSLPELVTTLTALAKKQAELSVGNILGANILNLTLIMPLSGVVSGKPMPVTQTGRFLDLPVVVLFSLIAMVPALISGKFRRWQGAVLLLSYIAYLTATCLM